MDWAAKQEVVRLAIAAALGMPDAVSTSVHFPAHRIVEWDGRASASRWSQSGKWANLRLFGETAKGVDYTATELIAGTPVGDETEIEAAYLQETQVGYRLFTVGVTIRSDSQEPGSTASALASRLRTRLRRPSVLAALDAGDVAIVRVENTIDADYVDREGRVMSAAVVDIRLATREHDTDMDTTADWVAEAAGDGELATGVDEVDITPAFDTAEEG